MDRLIGGWHAPGWFPQVRDLAGPRRPLGCGARKAYTKRASHRDQQRMKRTDPAFQRAAFLASVAEHGTLPADRGHEVAFAGRSNAGKSTLLNAVTGRRALARTGKLPGRTRALVFFDLGADRRLVDLPGYGYARLPRALGAALEDLLVRYVVGRRALTGVVLVMDVRRPPGDEERALLERLAAAAVPAQLCLSKVDRVSRAEAERARAALWRALPPVADPVILCSARSGGGVQAVRARVAEWLRLPTGGTQAKKGPGKIKGEWTCRGQSYPAGDTGS